MYIYYQVQLMLLMNLWWRINYIWHVWLAFIALCAENVYIDKERLILGLKKLMEFSTNEY